MNSSVRISSSSLKCYGGTSAKMKYRHLVFCLTRWISINTMWDWNNSKKYYYRLSRKMAFHQWQLSEILISFLGSDCWSYGSILSKYKHTCLSSFKTNIGVWVSWWWFYKTLCSSERETKKTENLEGVKNQGHTLYAAWERIK